jgi:hypothetical protein
VWLGEQRCIKILSADAEFESEAFVYVYVWAGDAGLRARELSVQSLCDVMTAARSFGLTRLQVRRPSIDQKEEGAL